jgi:hypothetical protein
MKNIVISVDKATARLFRRYGFRKYRTLPTTQKKAEEFLFVLKTGSSEYRKTIVTLGNNSSAVQQISEEL